MNTFIEWHKKNIEKYSKKFIKDKEFSKMNKLGIWSMNFEYPWNFRKSS